jgi:hypothetical protein
LRRRRRARILARRNRLGSKAVQDVVLVLRTMGPEQFFLALVFLAAYSLALGEFAPARARMVAAATAAGAAAAFAALSAPWEAAVVLLAFAFVFLALFSAVAWLLWQATAARDLRAGDQAPAAKVPRAAAASSSRSRKSAPILNSPAAE